MPDWLKNKETLRPLLITVGASVLLSQWRSLFFLFILPLYTLYLRHGKELYRPALGGVVLFSAAVSAVRTAALDVQGLLFPLFVFDIAPLVVTSAGLLALSWRIPYGRSDRLLHRLYLAAMLGGLVSLPIIGGLQMHEGFLQELNKLFDSVAAAFQEMANPERGLDAAMLAGIFDPREMIPQMKEMFFRTYVFSLFFILAGLTHICRQFERRRMGREPIDLRTFMVDDRQIWVLIASMAVVLIGHFRSLPVLDKAGWNIFLVAMLTFGLQGIGIIKELFYRKGFPPGYRLVLILAAAAALLNPWLNRIVLIGIPGLGVSEIWIKYRAKAKESKGEDNIE